MAAGAAAQDTADFLGHWVLLNPSDVASDIAQELTVRQSFERHVNVITIERRATSGVRSETYTIGTVGGVVGGLVSRSGRGSGPDGQIMETRFSTKWDGNRLVIQTGSYSGPTLESGPYTEHDEVWSLDPEGRLSITVTDRSSDAEPRTANLTYLKQ
jgi:hypothetical protein